MTRERYQHVKAILNEVLDTPPAERESVLARHCSHDGELESEIRRMLAGMDVDGVLDRPPLGPEALRAVRGAEEDAAELALLPGELLSGRFRMVRLLGRGGMGQVWEAVDEELQEPIAIKTLRRQEGTDPKTIARLKREALNARRVASPNVCKVFDFFLHPGEDGPIPYLTMQLLHGETLAERLARAGPLNRKAAGAILGQCAAALSAAHATGLVHGDFKPGNVMLVESGDSGVQAVVTDFGIARSVAGPNPAGTISLDGAGTPAYMAPEQAAGLPLKPAADVYSFAVVACEVLTGLRPSEGGIDKLPSAWQGPIRRALDPDPERRGGFPGTAKKPSGRIRLAAAMILLLIAALAGWRYFTRVPDAIAVLPFTQLSGDAEDRELGERLADEVISSLSRARDLLVIARTSSVRLNEPNPETARRLGVRYLLSGTIRGGGGRLQITAQLVDPIQNAVLWLETFERDRSQMASVHAEIARGVSTRLGLRVSLAQAGAFGSVYPRQEAADLFARGRRLWSTRSPSNLAQALADFTRAIEIDPNFALAHAARADTLAILAEGSYLPSAEAFPKAKESALQAVILSPQLPEAHAALGLTQNIGEWDLYNAEKSLRRAIELGPSYVYARQWHAAALMKLGRSSEAVAEAETVVRLDPLSVAPLAALGWTYFYTGHYGEARAVADRLAAEHPQFPYTCLMRSESWLAEGMLPQSRDAIGTCGAEVRTTPVYLLALGVLQAQSGDTPAAIGTVKRMLDAPGPRVGESYPATVYAALNLRNEAFYWLDQGIIHHDPLTALVDVTPFFAPIRSDPRYAQILERIGLPHKK